MHAHSRLRLAAPLTSLLVLAMPACDDGRRSPPAAPASHGSGAAMLHASLGGDRNERHDLGPQLAELRAAKAAFHDIDVARAAGYTARLTDCLSDPAQGGMGFHYADGARLDATVERLRPEALLYEPQRNGKLRLVAVEYIVPYSAWTRAEPPSLHGLSFHPNPGFKVWMLHAWIWRNNPSGTFADWNPKVTCPAAE